MNRDVCRLLCLGWLLSGPGVRAQSADGDWLGQVEQAGGRQSIYLSMSGSGEAREARISIPAMDLWDYSLGRFEVAGDTLSMPALGWSLQWDADHEQWRGHLPAALVPVYQIPLQLSKTETIPSAPALPSPGDLPPKPSWTRKMSAPVWAGVLADPVRNRVFIADSAGLVLALCARDGHQLMKAQIDGKVYAQPTLVGEFLLINADRYLYKLSARTGKVIWRQTLDAGKKPRIAAGEAGSKFDRYGSSARFHDGQVLVGSRDGALYAIDFDNGEVDWRFQTSDLITATPTISDGRVIVGSFDGLVYALEMKTGAEIWRHDTGKAVPAEAVLAGDRVLVGSRSYDLLALNTTSGVPDWRYYLWFSWIESVPVVRDGVAYVGSSDAISLFALDTDTGRERWRAPLYGFAWSNPAVDKRQVFIGTVGTEAGGDRRRAAIHAVDRQSGQVRWSYLIDRPDQAKEWGVAAGLAVVGRHVIAADLSGRVYALPR